MVCGGCDCWMILAVLLCELSFGRFVDLALDDIFPACRVSITGGSGLLALEV